MKRIISCLLILVMLMAAIPASAAAKTELVFSAPYAVVGETLTLNIYAKNLPKCAGYGIFLKYDQEALKLTHFKRDQAGDGLDTNEIAEKDFGEETFVFVSENQVSFHNIKLEGFEGKKCPLATLKFKVLSMPKNEMLSFDIVRGEAGTMFADTSESPKEIEYSFEPLYVPVYKNHPFTDITADWYKEAVLFAYNKKLMNGVAENKFDPDGATTRGMLTTILYRKEFGDEMPEFKKAPFTDLQQNWYKTPINWAFEKEIVKGESATLFAPEKTVTREQIATMLYRYAKYDKRDVSQRKKLTSFSDSKKVNSWAKEAMEWAYAEGLITGNSINGKVLLDPQGAATRAQIATILMRYIRNSSEQ